MKWPLGKTNLKFLISSAVILGLAVVVVAGSSYSDLSSLISSPLMSMIWWDEDSASVFGLDGRPDDDAMNVMIKKRMKILTSIVSLKQVLDDDMLVFVQSMFWTDRHWTQMDSNI